MFGVGPRHGPVVVEMPVVGLVRVTAVRGVVAPAEGARVVRDGVAVVNDALVTAVGLDAGGLFEFVGREGTETNLKILSPILDHFCYETILQ